MPTGDRADYWIWGVDNQAYGPVDLPALTSWISDQRVQPDTWVFNATLGRWTLASELPEVRDLLPQAGTGVPAALQSDPRLQPRALRRIKILADVEEKYLARLVPYVEMAKYKQFAQVVRAGDHGDAMFFILEGELRARVLIEGKETTLSTLAAGDFFGEISLLDQGPRSADVVANQDSLVLKISSTAFEKIVREEPQLALQLLLALSRSIVTRTRLLTKRYEDTVHFSRLSGNIAPGLR